MEFNEENIIRQFDNRKSITSAEFRRIFGIDYVNWKLKMMEAEGKLISTKGKVPNIDGKLLWQKVWKLT